MALRRAYNLGEFLRDMAPIIIGCILFGAFMTFMLSVIGVTIDAIVLLDILFVLMLCITLCIYYFKRARYWNKLLDASEAIDKIGQFEALIYEPDFLDAEVAKKAIDNLFESYSAEIESLRCEYDSRSRYIEQWVHEVKTPIATSKLILDQTHGEHSDSLKTELERMERLVEQAMYAAKLEDLSSDYLIKDVSLCELVTSACKANMQLLTAKGIRVEIQVSNELEILADKAWLEFIISQLVVNSAKYDASEIAFSAAESGEEGSAGETILTIRDDGCGIPAEDVPRVFDRGFTGSVGRSHSSATGMGLFLAARMCAQMGLGISVTSEVGIGTSVRLFFPHDNERRRFYRNLTQS